MIITFWKHFYVFKFMKSIFRVLYNFHKLIFERFNIICRFFLYIQNYRSSVDRISILNYLTSLYLNCRIKGNFISLFKVCLIVILKVFLVFLILKK